MITVIVPVYNVEKYLDRQLESITSQTYRDLEIILVDDGSTDSSGAKCEQWAARDSRIRVLHQANAGAPQARNRALRQARGRYVIFLDADDECASDMLETLHATAERDGSDYVVCGFKILTLSRRGKYEQVQAVPSRVFTDEVSLRAASVELFEQNLLYTPWNKLFRRSFLRENQIFFPSTFWDDFPFNLAALRHATKVSVVEQPLYSFYRERAESETAKYRPDVYAKRLEEHEWLKSLYRDWGLLGRREVRGFLARRHLERLLGCVENVCEAGAELSLREQWAQVRAILADPNIPALRPYYRARGLHTGLVMRPLLRGQTKRAWLTGHAIRFVKQHLTALFAFLKHRR